jgi:multicomponent Na+:H+ antiporter subunit G
MLIDILVGILLVTGGIFFTAGTIGLIRFPDIRSQLHALTKADNLGLGLIFAGVTLHLASWGVAVVLLLTWLLALLSASLAARVLANSQRVTEGRDAP